MPKNSDGVRCLPTRRTGRNRPLINGGSAILGWHWRPADEPEAPPTKPIPRKQATQARAARTVEVILEAAAHILERDGFAGYTTNAIAERAGASIGSLYQYFPNKDAITVTMIDQRSAAVVG